jgi:glycerol-3-phosphate dehydrogenase
LALDAVDRAVENIERAVAPSRTRDVVIVGGENWSATWGGRRQMASDYGIDVMWIEHLLRRYGSLTSEVLDVLGQDRSLAAPLPGSDRYLRCEIHYAVTHEGALHLDDVLSRRTHVSIEASDRGTEAARHVGAIMAPLLGWDRPRLLEELARYDSSVASR